MVCSVQQKFIGDELLRICVFVAQVTSSVASHQFVVVNIYLTYTSVVISCQC